MTEHEKKVNEKDIKAYEEMDTKTLNSKIPGIRTQDQNLQEKYMDKMF